MAHIHMYSGILIDAAEGGYIINLSLPYVGRDEPEGARTATDVME